MKNVKLVSMGLIVSEIGFGGIPIIPCPSGKMPGPCGSATIEAITLFDKQRARGQRK